MLTLDSKAGPQERIDGHDAPASDVGEVALATARGWRRGATDTTGAGCVDSPGVAARIALVPSVRRARGEVALRHLSSSLREALELLRAHRVFTHAASRSCAIRSFARMATTVPGQPCCASH